MTDRADFMQRHPPLPKLLERAFEEFDFLFERIRDRPYDDDRTRDDLAETEARMKAALNVLRVAGEYARPVLEEALGSQDVSTATAAVYAATELDREWLADEILGDLLADEVGLDAIRVGLRFFPIDDLAERLEQTAAASDPFGRACLGELLAHHGRRPSDEFETLLDSEDLEVRQRALRAVGRNGDVDWIVRRLERDLVLEDDGVADALIAVAARADEPELRRICRKLAGDPSRTSPTSVRLLGVVGEEADVAALGAVLTRSRGADALDVAEATLDGLGALGYPAAIPSILDAMQDPLLARVAGRAFVRLTGADDLAGDDPLAIPDGLEGEPAEAWDDSPLDVDPERASLWWRSNRDDPRFDSRVQHGSPSPRGGAGDDRALRSGA